MLFPKALQIACIKKSARHWNGLILEHKLVAGWDWAMFCDKEWTGSTQHAVDTYVLLFYTASWIDINSHRAYSIPV